MVQRLGLVIKRLRVRYGRRKQIATVVLQLELFTYCCLMFPITCIALVLRLGQSTPYRRSACIDMEYGHVEACGSGFLPHGLNFSTAWCTMRLISVEKDWKHVSMQKVVTLNTCCDVACLTFQLPHITTGSFQSHQCQPTACFFQSHQRLKECNKPSVR